jgi:epoxyqueuosine reductase
MSLREYLELTDAEFRAVFKNSPIKRIKRRGFLRNVCVALGNAGGVSDIPALERALADEEPLIAEHADRSPNSTLGNQSAPFGARIGILHGRRN